MKDRRIFEVFQDTLDSLTIFLFSFFYRIVYIYFLTFVYFNNDEEEEMIYFDPLYTLTIVAKFPISNLKQIFFYLVIKLDC